MHKVQKEEEVRRVFRFSVILVVWVGDEALKLACFLVPRVDSDGFNCYSLRLERLSLVARQVEIHKR